MARTVDEKLHDKRRRQILDAAANCFTENGFHQTGMQQICKQANMSAGSVYHYFANKSAIIEAIAQAFSTDTDQFIGNIDSKTQFIDGYIKAVRASLKETQKYIKYGRLMVEIYAESFRNDKVKNILQVLDEHAIDALKSRIKTAMSSGQIATTHDPEILAHILIALLEGLEDRILQHPKIKLTKLLKPFESICQQLLLAKQ